MREVRVINRTTMSRRHVVLKELTAARSDIAHMTETRARRSTNDCDYDLHKPTDCSHRLGVL
jgi:hypothetical protein